MEFEQVWPGARVLLMEHNYRSGSEIVDAANHFVARNRYRRPKVMRPTCGAQGPLEVVRIHRREEQIDWLADRVRQGETLAVLFRNNESALPLIDLCERNALPYRFAKSDLTFFTDKIVLDVTDFLQFAQQPANGELFMRLYYKFGLPVAKRQALYACAQSARSGRPILEELLRCPEVKPRLRGGLADAWAALKQLPHQSAARAIDTLRDGVGYGAYLEQKKMDSGKLSILGLLAAQEPSPARLLRRLEELPALLAAHQDLPDAPLTLSTIHSSKGLEYDTVGLLDVFDGILPAQLEVCCRTPEDTRRYEEDRRLYYVAMTRAKRRLVLFDCPAMPSVFTQEVLFNLPEARAGAPGRRSRPGTGHKTGGGLCPRRRGACPQSPSGGAGGHWPGGCRRTTCGVRPGRRDRGERPVFDHPLCRRQGAPPGRPHGGGTSPAVAGRITQKTAPAAFGLRGRCYVRVSGGSLQLTAGGRRKPEPCRLRCSRT